MKTCSKCREEYEDWDFPMNGRICQPCINARYRRSKHTVKQPPHLSKSEAFDLCAKYVKEYVAEHGPKSIRQLLAAGFSKFFIDRAVSRKWVRVEGKKLTA